MKNTSIIIFLALISACQEKELTQINLDHSPQDIELFGEHVISTNLNERDIAISPKGTEIIFTIGNFKQTIRCLVIIKKYGKNWGQKEILSFSGMYQDIEPFYSFDGDQLFFASNRPIFQDSTRTDYNIWVSTRTNSDWSDPVPLNEDINSDRDEFYPSLSKNGNLYFTATKENGIGREDIFMSEYADGNYQPPEPLDTTINSSAFEFNSFINPDEDLIIFSSFGREDDLGGGDLYYSKKALDGKWKKALKMENKINSNKLDYCPFIDYSNGNFYFTSERIVVTNKRILTVQELEEESNKIVNGLGNIYRISLENLNLQ